MLQRLQSAWRKWRENSRQRSVDRALYKAGGGGNPTRQATRGSAYAPGDVRHAERAADEVAGQDSSRDAVD
jgi:hypothetical protein